jgi:hypothetical protein
MILKCRDKDMVRLHFDIKIYTIFFFFLFKRKVSRALAPVWL